jgi:uncharacterized repeat protein (TIGR01451 family)
VVSLEGTTAGGTVYATRVGKYFLIAATVLLPAPALAGYYVLPTRADSYLKEAAPAEPHGSDAELSNKLKAGDNLRSIWQFDLSPIPAGETVVSAVAVFHVTLSSNEPVGVYRITDAWTEAAANWNNLSGSYDALTRYGVLVPAAPGPVAVDLTGLVREWVDGVLPAYGVVFVSEVNDKESRYASKESSDPDEKPFLLVKTAELPAMRMATGSFLGNSSGPRPFSGLGFTPDVVLIKANNNTATVAKTSTMYGDAAKELGPGSGLLADEILSLDADGFTVGSGGGVNQSGIQYFWVAFSAAPGEMVVGSYVGEGTDDRDITGIGFQPEYLIVMAESGQKAMQRYAAHSGDASRDFEKSDPQSDRIQAFLPDGFQVGSHNSVNDGKVVYHYVAWNATPGYVESSSYGGDGTDNRNVLGLGFQPGYMFLTAETNTYETVHRMASMTGDLTLRVNTGTVLGNQIQSFAADGFQVGSDKAVNDATETYFWTAFRDHRVLDADVQLTVAVDDSLLSEKHAVTFFLALSNAGPADALGIEVTDLLPDGLTYVTHSSTQGSYDELTGIWTVGDIAEGGTAGLSIAATVDPGTAGATLVNEAKVTGAAQADPDETNNADSARVHVRGVDIATGKSVDNASPNEGDTVTYRIRLTNAGPDSASGVEVRDRLPDGVTYVADAPTRGVYSEATSRWSVGALAAGDTAWLEIQASVEPGTGGTTVVNTASLASVDQTDMSAANDSASAGFTVQSADLAVRMTVDDPTPVEGDAVTFTVRVSNDGPDGATGVEISDLLPAGLTYSGFTATQGTYDDVTGVWSAGTVAVSGSATLSIDVTVDAGTGGWTISNLAAVTASDQSDPVAADNIALAKLTVQSNLFGMASGVYSGDGALTRSITGVGFRPDVVILQGDDGQPMTVKTSSMPAAASKEVAWPHPMVTDVVTSLDADGFTVSPNGSMNAAGNEYAWVAFKSAPGNLVVGSYTGDGNDARVVAGLGFTPAYVMVLPESYNEAVQRFPSQSGDRSITFGYSDESPNWIQGFLADGFEVGTDSLVNAPGLTYHYVAWKETAGITTGNVLTGDGFDNRNITGLGFEPEWVILKRESSPNGTVHHPAALPGDLTLSARDGYTYANGIQALLADGFQVGSDISVNQSSVGYHWMAFRDPSAPQADLDVAMTVSDAVPIEGDTLAYTVTLFNNGPDAADGVELIDLLPQGLGYLSDTPSQGTYTPATGLWNVGSILSGDSASLDLFSVVDPGMVDSTIVNLAAIIAANQTDPDTTNNAAGIPITVGPAVFRVTSGSYVGNGVGGRAIAGVGFAPDVVLIKGDNASTPVMRTSTFTGDNTKPVGARTGFLPNMIESLDSDGFSVGNSNRVNQPGATYYWTAFRAARPELAVGSYVGDGSDDRSIDVGFQPEYVIVMSEAAEHAVQRFGSQAGDASLLFSSSDPLSDRIQAFEPDGFQVGQHASTNASGDTLHYVAWKAALDRCEGGAYIGDGTDDRDITGNSFNPNFLLVQRNEAGSAGVFRTIALSGDNTLPATPEPLFPDRIQSFLPDGFQVGTSPEVNESSGTYFWVAFKDEQYLDVAVAMTVDDPTPNAGDLVQFTISVLNNGPADASGIVVGDVLPAGLSYDSDTPGQGTYDPVAGEWEIGSLPSAASADLQLRATVDAGTAGWEIVNTAALWLVDQNDIAAGNNSADASITVGSADLAVGLSVDRSFPAEGDTIVYTITVANYGPGEAAGVLVADSLPQGVTYLFDVAVEGSYDSTSGTWTVGAVADGDVDTLLVYGRIETGTLGRTLTNFARIAGSDVEDPDSTNNVDAVAVVVPTPVALDDAPGSLFPDRAFVGDPDLALRIGVDNPWDVGVTLDTVSTVSFTDGIRIYAAELANETFVPPHANDFVLSFERNTVPAGMKADSTYDLRLELVGETGELRPYAQTITTAGTNAIFVDQPKMTVEAMLLGDHPVHPGRADVEVLSLRFENHYTGERTLDSLAVTNAASGAGTPAQLDALASRLSLYADVDGSFSYSAPDTLLATSVFSGGRAVLAPPAGWTIPASGTGALVMTADVDSSAARDGDRLDARVTSQADIAFAEPTVFDGEISPLYPLDSYGSAVIDGMVAHQIGLAPVSGDTLYSGAVRSLVLAAVLPQNGYDADTLLALNVKDFSGAFDPADFDRLTLYRDDGDRVFDSVADLPLGDMVFSGDRFEVSGLYVPTGPGELFYVTADVDIAAANGHTFRPGIPVDGVTVASNNDGPIDIPVVSGTSFTLVRVEKVDVVALPLSETSRPAPGDKDVELLRIEVRNNTLSAVTIDSLGLANATGGAGAQADRDGEIDGVQVYVDDGNGRVDAWDLALARNLPFTSGSLVTGYLGYSLEAGEAAQLLVACDVDSFCARDGDTPGVRVSSAADIHIDSAFPVSGAFPLETDVARAIDGMMPFQIGLHPSADSTAIAETDDILILDLEIPSNGYAVDTLTSLRVTNFGSADEKFIETVDLWADGGNGTFDRGAGDDLWLAQLVSLGGRQYQRSGLSYPLLQTCPAKNRVFVSCDLREDYKFSATIQFGVRKNDIGVASGNDGPRGADVVDPSVGIIPKPDQVTVFPYAVGDKRVYPGSENVLNYGIGLYNGFSNAITLDEISLLLKSSADHSDIAVVRAFADSDTNGLFDPDVDEAIASATSKSQSFVLSGLGLKLPPEDITYLFVAYDLNMAVGDSVVIDFYVPTASELSFIPPVDTNLSGEFADSPGKDVTDGMIAAQIALASAPVDRAAPGDPAVLAMGLTIPANGPQPDQLEFVTIVNAGDAVAVGDIEHLNLWMEAGEASGDPDAFDPGDRALATLGWTGASWSNQAALDEPVPTDGLKCYVTFAAAPTANDDRTFQAELPVGGIEVLSGNDGPLDSAVVNPNAQTISTDPLITTLSTDRSSYSTGQEIVLSMRLRNEGADSLLGVTAPPPLLSGTGSASVISGPLPPLIDLTPGSDTTLVWRYAALLAGDLEFCGFAHNGDSTEVSLQTCSPQVEIQDKPAEISLSLRDVSPIAVNRGQDNVAVIAIDLAYENSGPLSAPVEFTGVEITVENGAGTPVAPNSALREATIVSSTGSNRPFSLADSTANPAHLYLDDPIEIAPGDSVRLDINVDISSSAALSPFRLSLQATSAIGVRDANDHAPVPPASGESFPWATSVIDVDIPADSLLAGAAAPQSVTVNNGQEGVDVFRFTLLNSGAPQAAGEVLSGITLSFHDTTGSTIAPAEVIRNLSLSSGGTDLFYTDDIPSSEAALDCNLSGVLLLPPQAARDVLATADLRSFPGHESFYVSLASPAAIVARDNNDGGFVTVAAAPPTTFPIESNRLHFQQAASGLSALHSSLAPRDILPSTSSVPLLDLVLTHADASASSIEVDSLAMAFVGNSGTPLFPGNYFSQLSVLCGPDTLAVLTSLSSSSHVVEARLAPSVTIAPSTSETFRIYVSSKSVYTPAEFRVRIDREHIVAFDANAGDRITAISGSFPFYSDAARLQIAGEAVSCALVSHLPPNVTGRETSLPAFDVVVRNDNPPGYTQCVLRGLSIGLHDWKGEVLDSSKLLSQAVLTRRGGTVATGTFGPAGAISFDVPDGDVTIDPGGADTLTVAVDVNFRGGETFRFVVADTASLDIRDAVTGGAIAAATIGNSGYPLSTNLAHVLGASSDAAFTNYPNPFAAGRQATRVTFFLDETSRVTLKLYTLWGARVKTLLDGESREPGLHQDVTWAGLNGDGDVVNNGVYYLVLEIKPSGGGTARSITRKVGVVR